jgi:hypothetical protein
MWYSKVVASLGNIPDFLAYYEQELEQAKRDVRIGGVIEKNITVKSIFDSPFKFFQSAQIQRRLNRCSHTCKVSRSMRQSSNIEVLNMDGSTSTFIQELTIRTGQ